MPVPFNPEYQAVKTAEELGKTDDLYIITKKDIKDNLLTIKDDIATKNSKELSPDVFGGPTEVEVGQVIEKTAEPGEYVQTMDGSILKVSTDGVGWLSSITVPANGVFYVKGFSVGNTDIWGESSGYENITVTEATPITLQKFDIELVDDKYPHLTWTTASETNCDYFSIERSFDGVSFDEIDRVDSKAENGTSRGPLSYEFTDKTEGLHGVVYYRFTQVDEDGTEKTYMIKSVDIKRKDLAPILSPNPVRSGGRVNLEIFDDKNNKYRIVNMNGQTMQEGKLSVGKKNALQLTGFPAGTYFIQIKEGEAVKLVVE